MLVLSRKLGEKIAVDDDIVITVVEIRGARVKIGIEAPRSRKIRRPDQPEKAPAPEDPAHAA